MSCQCRKMSGDILTVDEELHEMHECDPSTCGCNKYTPEQVAHMEKVLAEDNEWTPEEDSKMRLRKFVCTECTVSNASTGKEVVAACTFITHSDDEDPVLVNDGICVLSGTASAYWRECNHA
jgi:hypothetical protein